MGETAAQIGHLEVVGPQSGGTVNNGGMAEALAVEPARDVTDAITQHHNIGTHLLERVNETKTVLVHGLVHNGGALRLGERHHERLLPVGHEPGVHVRFKYHRLQLTTGVGEADPLIFPVINDFVTSPSLTENIKKRRHILLVSTAHKNIAAGSERR